MRIASSRRMVVSRFTTPDSHNYAKNESPSKLTTP